MKKGYKKVEIIGWLLVAVILTGFLYSALDRNQGLYFINGNFFEFNVKRNLSNINMKTIDSKKITNVNDLKEINIRTKKSDIKLLDSDDDNINIEIKCNKRRNIDKNKYLKITNKSGVLNIENSYNKGERLFENLNMIIQIELPERYQQNLNIESDIGDIDILKNKLVLNKLRLINNVGDVDLNKDIKVNNTEISIDTGDMEIESLNSDSYKLTTDIGNIEIDSILGGGDITANTGDIDVSTKTIDKDINISSDTGDLDINIDKNSSFKVNVNKSFDDIDTEIKFKNAQLSGDKFSGEYGENPTNNLNLKTDIGDINIEL